MGCKKSKIVVLTEDDPEYWVEKFAEGDVPGADEVAKVMMRFSSHDGILLDGLAEITSAAEEMMDLTGDMAYAFHRWHRRAGQRYPQTNLLADNRLDGWLHEAAHGSEPDNTLIGFIWLIDPKDSCRHLKIRNFRSATKFVRSTVPKLTDGRNIPGLSYKVENALEAIRELQEDFEEELEDVMKRFETELERRQWVKLRRANFEEEQKWYYDTAMYLHGKPQGAVAAEGTGKLSVYGYKSETDESASSAGVNPLLGNDGDDYLRKERARDRMQTSQEIVFS